MNDIELAKMLFGEPEAAASTSIPGRTRTYTGTAVADSEGGYVEIQPNGNVVNGNDTGTVLLPTKAIVKEGDIVDITVVNGSPSVSGANGWGDGLNLRVSTLVADTADIGTIRANAAKVQNLTAEELETDHATIGSLSTTYASISNLDAATARIDDLEADHVTTQQFEAVSGRVGTLEADHVTTQQFEAVSGRVGTLEADHVTTQQFEAVSGRVGTLEADHVTTGDLSAATARIDDLEADHVSVSDFQAEQGYIDALQASTADIDTIRANAAKVQNLTAAQLEADHATIGTLETTYAKVDMANVSNGWIQNGTIKDGAITNAMINSVSANKLTAGTIDASDITVTNLNASNITTGTINGQRIGTGSLSLDKLSEDVYTESEVDAKLATMQSQIDGAIETWTGTAVPTLNNAPASNWKTAEARDSHVGDVYFVVNSDSQQNGYNYRFTKSGNTYSWQLIKDNDVTQALSRLSTAEGKITSIESFDSEISSWKTSTDEELSSYKSRTTSLETRMTDAEEDLSTKVETSTFNTLSQTVDSNTSSITSLSTVVTNNGLTSSTNITNTVNTVSNTATSNSSKIESLTSTLGTNADGTTKDGDIVHRTSAVEQDLSSFKTTVSNTYATTTALGGVEATANNANNKLVAYSATSSTGATTATKVAVCTNFALSTGVTVTVRFSTASTATGALSLNVNSTGAKQIYVNGAVTGTSNQLLWSANANITFTYDGTYWRVDSEPRTWYGTCSTAASTAAKTTAINEVVICKGTQVVLNMTYENTNTSATLNVTSTAAKNIYYGTTTTRPTTDNGYGWTASSTATFIFDGAYWRIGDTSAMSKITATNSVVAQHTTKIEQTEAAIALKADSATTYTKTDVDGLISTEVTNRNAAIKTASDNISLSVSETYATQSDLDDIEDRVSSAEASISVNAGNIESKVSKNGVISSINQSSESITIDANRVNIAGAAIFTSGRLSETTLNSTYATPDDIPTKVSELTNDSGFQTASQVDTTITGKGYQTAAQVESAITGKGYATTAQANAQEQLIYKSAASGTDSMSSTTAWVTASDDTQNAWTTKRPTYSASYPVLFVATQRKSVSGSVTCTTPVKDDTTTVIDGGHITTGTIDASKATITNISATNISSGTLDTARLNADTITSQIVQTASLSADNITSGSLSADRIATGTLSVDKITPNDQNRILNSVVEESIAETYATIDHVASVVSQTSESFTVQFSQHEERLSELDQAVDERPTHDDIDTAINGLVSNDDERLAWLSATTENGKPVLTLGTSETNYAARFDNEALSFMNGGTELATFGGIDGAHMPNAAVDEVLKIGAWILEERKIGTDGSNKHLTLKYGG